MRITKLKLKNYKNLQNFEWELNPDYPVAVIVGKNGSGKTNLLEAIITIFQDLQLYDGESKRNKLPDFNFELHYLYGENNDEIVIKKDGKIEITKNGENIALNRLNNFRQIISQGEEILPKNIFVYYAGNTTRLEELCDRSIGEYKKTLIDIATNKVELQTSPKQPLFYYDLIHHRAVFLTLMLSSLQNIQEGFLKNDLGIETLVRVDFKLSRPNWKPSSADLNRFWDAPIYLQKILDTFRETAEIEIGKDSRIDIEIFGDTFQRKFAETSNEKEFFQHLSNLILAEYLAEVKIYFKKDGIDKILEFADLSEGEWQRIGIRGAMELFQGEETLFLLDEPDTFAHPRWQWDFVPDINETIGKETENKATQVIFITHSPLVLSSTEKNAFFLESGIIEELRDSFGQDANMSLIKMGVNPQYEEIDKDFQYYFELIKAGKGETDEAVTERNRLETIYGLNHEKFDSADILISYYR